MLADIYICAYVSPVIMPKPLMCPLAVPVDFDHIVTNTILASLDMAISVFWPLRSDPPTSLAVALYTYISIPPCPRSTA